MDADFFISFASDDRAWAEWIAWELEDAGYAVVLQGWPFRPGANFAVELQRAPPAQLIALLSPSYLAALQTQSEWGAAFERGSSAIPIRVRECDPVGPLALLECIDLVGLDDADARAHLLAALHGRRQKPEDAAPHDPAAPAVVFVFHERDDQTAERLARLLVPLQRAGVIGRLERRAVADPALAATLERLLAGDVPAIVVPLISADLLASDFAFRPNVDRLVFESTRSATFRVIPVLVRPAVWESSGFGRLQVLPRNARPITEWESRGSAEGSVADGLRVALDTLVGTPAPPPPDEPKVVHELGRVFVRSGMPTITFVEPDDFYLLKLSLTQPGRGVVLEGPSGIGKTTALRRALADLEGNAALGDVTELSARNPAHVERLRSIGSWHAGTVAVDDFHRLDAPLRMTLGDHLKYLADVEQEDRRIVLVGVPDVKRGLVEDSHDLGGRFDVIRFDQVKDDVVLAMIAKGEDALNISLERKDDLVRAASGSLSIAQILCFQICARNGVVRTQPTHTAIHSDVDDAVAHALAHMEYKFSGLVRAFDAAGGASEHIGIELLQELSWSEDGSVALEQLARSRPALAPGIRRFVEERLINEIRERYPDYEQHILYDDRDRRLTFDDPQLAFYLRSTPRARWITPDAKPAVTRTAVFVSYSHHDATWLEQLRVHLRPLERDHAIDIWADVKLEAGELWEKEISRNLASAGAAVLLVSAHFLASDFIVDNELPPLLRAAHDGGTRIMPLIVSPCRFRETPALSQFQAFNDPDEPLIGMSPVQRETLLVEVSRQVQAACQPPRAD